MNPTGVVEDAYGRRIAGSDHREARARSGHNPLLPLIDAGAAEVGILAVLAREQRLVVAADLLSFRHLAERSAAEEPDSAPFFAMLAEGEAVAAQALGVYAEACGVDADRSAAYEPLPGCRAHPSYVARLALDAAPVDVVLALSVNFASWGGYCATSHDVPAGAYRREGYGAWANRPLEGR
ncbi:hypothetical protein [Streptomyces stelliscabiei]|uniref:Uncharacterized protein n=1 Tax=Streptomyces stelliscabiei TaxID=146820 RepID=A0A8I0NX70_9ACTN|nr:hypothetical protein [Streptomyces stelliscabiei]MBE1595361.1 hypothetical protein [Streptomyces stelliscabiei]MDX2517388.1 hypothetical protein [Streptomyces stelliscabiei]MDX2554532.1 hypothetical protein [Streptomyces stelliscabiei]MDX2613060.1 hypothetical protein [Streptomyces stelliscabiei]MDX2638664.1 hypothetical protein [Streptomyces stelliscabiei]